MAPWPRDALVHHTPHGQGAVPLRVAWTDGIDRMWLPQCLDEVVELPFPTFPCRRIVGTATTEVQRMCSAASTAPVAFVERKRVSIVEAIEVYE